jgi:tRNA pseudouridine38-40 synthase
MTEHPPPGAASVTRWKVECAYDGTAFAGWQSQPGGVAIQDVIEARLRQIAGEGVRIHASGRTDAGVHALGQVFHFDLAWRHGATRLLAALRVGLPRTVQIRRVAAVAADFHARFQATGKRYEYRIFLGHADPFVRPFVWEIDRPQLLDLAAMKRAAEVLRGRHDFAAFSALNGDPRASTVRDLRRLEIRRRGRHLAIVAEADGFLYKMVRSLVGALVSVGLGKLTAERVAALLARAERRPEIETAPPEGLFLLRVFYGGKAEARPGGGGEEDGDCARGGDE